MTITPADRMTTEELVARAWGNLRDRAVVRRIDGKDLPEKCPPDVLMILEAAAEIAQWRAMEAARPKRRR